MALGLPCPAVLPVIKFLIMLDSAYFDDPLGVGITFNEDFGVCSLLWWESSKSCKFLLSLCVGETQATLRPMH